MTDVENLVLEHLKRIQGQIARVDDRLSTIEAELRSVKQHIAALITSDAARDGKIASFEVRLERIERRLDLVE